MHRFRGKVRPGKVGCTRVSREVHRIQKSQKSQMQPSRMVVLQVFIWRASIVVGVVIEGVAAINGVAVLLLFGEGGYLWHILCGRVG